MLKNILNILLLSSILLPIQLFSQSHNDHKCGTDFYHDAYYQNNPAEYEEFIQHLNERDVTPFKAQRRGDLRIIPVVFHIIHQGGTENIGDDQIISLLTKLNDDFQGRNADSASVREIFKPVYANMNIEFRLANIDPSGRCTNGVNRIYSDKTTDARDNVKSLIQWDNQKYLNVWVVKSIYNFGQAGTILGYATFPKYAISNPTKDGIVIRSDFQMYGGRTLTHEIGHWLGLFHTFQSGCGGDCETSGDLICDTPPVYEDSYGCDANKNSCHQDSPDLPDMNENHMDYTSCRLMFSKGQKEVADYYLASNYRKSLITNSNIQATGVNNSGVYTCIPVADFDVQDVTHCSNSGVEFIDQSAGSSDISYKWYFDGGTPTSSTDQHPVILYASPGKYSEKLVVSTSNGKDSLLKDNIVMIYPEEGNSIAYRENFEDPNFADDFWFIQEEQNSVEWKRTNNSSYEGSYSLFLNNFYSNTANLEYYFITPPVNLTAVNSPAMYFKYAHAQKTADSKDILRIYVSKNCGESWSLRKIINQINLPTAGQLYPTNFAPQNKSLWRDFVLDLSNYQGQSNVLVKVSLFSQGGNNMYVDDLKFFSTTSIDNEISSDAQLKIYPVPTSDHLYLESPINIKDANIYITDVMGHIVFEQKQITLDATNPLHLNLTQINTGKSGVYFILLEAENLFIRKKFSIIK
ncbi:MAG: T9SS type A sorting domain-containing protein [Bacteroidetes bacterium]|nr:T9SS type A sorting domain-containing protein [Bacteroidota bacterium]